MSLIELQILFARCLGKLLTYADDAGITVVGGEWLRSPAEAERLRDAGLGTLNSLHILKLAVDLTAMNLVGGSYMPLVDGRAPQYKLLGDRWKSYHPLCRWGGDFKRPDWDHYSITYQGRA